MRGKKRREVEFAEWLNTEIRQVELLRAGAISTGRTVDAAFYAGRLYELRRQDPEQPAGPTSLDHEIATTPVP